MASGLVISRSRFSNIDEFRRSIRGAEFHAVQLRPGVFSGNAAWCSLGGLWFGTGHFEGDVRARSRLPDRMVLGIHFGRTACRVSMCGLEALPGDIFLMRPGSEQEGRATGRVRYALIALDAPTMLRLGVLDTIGGSVDPARPVRRFRAPISVRQRICRSIANLVRLLGGTMAPLTPWESEALQRTLLWPFMLGLSEAGKTAGISVPSADIGIVRRVEDWIDAQPSEAVHLLDICRGLNVPLRTLQRGFHQELGMGPSHYLTLRRLANARASLLRAEADSSVTDIALSHGFWELGRFAGTYRHLYGEKPSETLHRVHGHQNARLMRRLP